MKRIDLVTLTARHRMKVLKYLWDIYPKARDGILCQIQDPKVSDETALFQMRYLYEKIKEMTHHYCVPPYAEQAHFDPSARPRTIIHRWKECPSLERPYQFEFCIKVRK